MLPASAEIAAWLVTLQRYATTVIAFVRLAVICIIQAARCKHFIMNLNFPDGSKMK